jgi:hypothetical protein
MRDDIAQNLRSAHTPIIITDGSASIEFERVEYTELENGEFESTHLKLSQVQIIDQNPDPNERHVSICGPFDPAIPLKITVLCAGRDFEVADQGGGRIRIKFHRGEYPEVGAAAGRRKFRQNSRRIMGMEIRNNTSGAVIHHCRIVPGNGHCQIKLVDSHM